MSRTTNQIHFDQSLPKKFIPRFAIDGLTEKLHMFPCRKESEALSIVKKHLPFVSIFANCYKMYTILDPVDLETFFCKDSKTNSMFADPSSPEVHNQTNSPI